MTSKADTSSSASQGRRLLEGRHVRGALVIVIGCVAMSAPFFAGPWVFSLGGLLLVGCGILEMLETFDAADDSVRCAYLSGELSVLAGILLLSLPEFVMRGVALVLAGWG